MWTHAVSQHPSLSKELQNDVNYASNRERWFMKANLREGTSKSGGELLQGRVDVHTCFQHQHWIFVGPPISRNLTAIPINAPLGG